VRGQAIARLFGYGRRGQTEIGGNVMMELGIYTFGDIVPDPETGRAPWIF
jgi:hypothetical protein